MESLLACAAVYLDAWRRVRMLRRFGTAAHDLKLEFAVMRTAYLPCFTYPFWEGYIYCMSCYTHGLRNE